MNRRVFAVAALLALAGCSSANDMLKKDPVYFSHTNHTPQQYANCVADAWRRDGEKVRLDTIDNGYDVVATNFSGVTAALRVQQWANGSVEIRMSARSSYGSQNMVQSANLCS
jgi:hypothetical protein